MPHRQPLGDLIARHLPYDDCRVPRLQLNHYLLRIHIFNIVCRACLWNTSMYILYSIYIIRGKYFARRHPHRCALIASMIVGVI